MRRPSRDQGGAWAGWSALGVKPPTIEQRCSSANRMRTHCFATLCTIAMESPRKATIFVYKRGDGDLRYEARKYGSGTQHFAPSGNISPWCPSVCLMSPRARLFVLRGDLCHRLAPVATCYRRFTAAVRRMEATSVLLSTIRLPSMLLLAHCREPFQ